MTSHFDEVACDVVVLDGKDSETFLFESVLFLQGARHAVESFDLESLIDELSSEVNWLSGIAHFLEKFSEIAQIL